MLKNNSLISLGYGQQDMPVMSYFGDFGVLCTVKNIYKSFSKTANNIGNHQKCLGNN